MYRSMNEIIKGVTIYLRSFTMLKYFVTAYFRQTTNAKTELL